MPARGGEPSFLPLDIGERGSECLALFGFFQRNEDSHVTLPLSLSNSQGNFLKDLTVLGRDLSRTVLVDNSPHAFGYQVDNGVPIESWFDCPHDKELLKLECFLRKLHGRDDVRDVVRRTFQTYRLVAEA